MVEHGKALRRVFQESQAEIEPILTLRIVGVPVCVAEYVDQNKECKNAKHFLIVLSLSVYLY